MWIVGHNMPGYLPESEPSAHEEWTDARDALVWDLDNLLLSQFEEEPRRDLLKFVALLERNENPQDVHFHADGYVWWIEKWNGD